MDFNIEVRRKQLENLDQLISSSRDRLKSVLSFLEWTPENVQKEDPHVACPINAHHRILPQSWKEHIEKCIITSGGYKINEQFLSEPPDPNNTNQSISLDRNKKIEVITKELSQKGSLKLAWNGLDPDPSTSDRLISTFSSDERLTFYNYCVENTTGPPPPPEFITSYSKSHNKDKPLTSEELLAQERDAKRRRAKYRSVHIDRKNHTEVMREVINGQMEDYKHWLETKDQIKTKSVQECEDDKREELERPPSSISRNSNHSGSSRSTSRKYGGRDRRDYSRERSSKYNRERYKSDDRYHRDRGNSDYHNNHRNNSNSRENNRRHSSNEPRSNRREYDSVRRH